MLEFSNFYKFTTLTDPQATGNRWLARARALSLRGTLLLATEGANISVAGEPAKVDAFTRELVAELKIEPGSVKRMPVTEMPFQRMLLKVKPEIVTTGWQANLEKNAGSFIAPDEFHRLAADPDVVLVDTRNVYETRVGSFRNAMLLPLEGFRQLPDYLPELEKHKDKKKIITFCTGGIRCEKAVPMLKDAGFDNVYQLEGGILAYLEKYPDGHWDGECFVFDERCTVTSDLKRGSYQLCEKCGQPYRDGACVSCSG
ncbi:MAG: rhodanese-like domain-containing protein [bacterium]|nr:rhodanese-like domain-containing protein [bacterium]